MPPLRLTVVAPRPAPTLPSAKSAPALGGRRVAELAIGRVAAPVLVAAGRAGRTGSRPARSARAPRAPAKPRPCSRSQACTPEAASSPKAEPPDSTMASMPLDRLRRIEQRGLARARPAAAHVDARRDRGSSNTTTVAPEPSLPSSAWPTRTPATSVMRLRMSSLRRAISRSQRRSHRRSAAHLATCADAWRMHEGGHAQRRHIVRRAARRPGQLPVALRAAAGAALSGLSGRHLAGAARRRASRSRGCSARRCWPPCCSSAASPPCSSRSAPAPA